jgi:3',5'-cyclic-AMP phosphodiesterase
MGQAGSWVALLAPLFACGRILGPGTSPDDYAPRPLRELGIHRAPTYVARYLMPARSMPLLLAHPRLGQPALRRPGEPFEVSWISRDASGQIARITIEGAMDSTEVATGAGNCDADGICRLEATIPDLPVGLHGLCVEVAGAKDCSPASIAVVDRYAEPAAVAQISDAHVGDSNSLAIFSNVIDAINALDPPADLALFTGDGPDTGDADQRADFVAQLARLHIPVFVVTGNHDYDHRGIDGHLLEVGPELDFVATYGSLHLIGLSTGQDLDDGAHLTTVAESDGPDASQLAWLTSVLDSGDPPTVVFMHHPIYNGLYATIGPDARDEMKALVTRDNVLAVLTGHIHATEVYDADGDSRGLSLDGEDDVPARRWPLHYIAKRASRGTGGFALLHLGASHVDYRWHALP